jgi:hypothetical protein
MVQPSTPLGPDQVNGLLFFPNVIGVPRLNGARWAELDYLATSSILCPPLQAQKTFGHRFKVIFPPIRIMRLLFRRPQAFIPSFASRIAVDFVMHNSSILDAHSSWATDALWYTFNSSLLLYVVSDPSSDLRIRQAVASFCHFHRLVVSSTISVCDVVLANTASAFFTKSHLFDPQQAKKRSFKRVMLTLRRNGGVYDQLFEILATMASPIPELRKIVEQPPLLSAAEGRPLAAGAVISLFESEIKRPFQNVFRSAPLVVGDVRDSVFQYDLELKSGRKVTLHVESPTLKRMREFDLFPFRCIASVLSRAPFLRPEGALLSAAVHRLDMDVGREREARRMILNGLPPRSKSIYVPAPLDGLSSEHIMVTEPELRGTPPPSEKLRRRLLGALGQLRDADLLLPGVGPKDVRGDGTRLGFRAFAGCVNVKAKHVELAGKLAAASLRGNRAPFVAATRGLGIDRKQALKACVGGGVVREVAREHPDMVVIGAEIIGGLAAHVAAVNRDGPFLGAHELITRALRP